MFSFFMTIFYSDVECEQMWKVCCLLVRDFCDTIAMFSLTGTKASVHLPNINGC